MEELFCGVPGRETWREIARVEKGWSEDEKYRITAADGRELLLRWGLPQTLARKRREYDAVSRLYASGVPVARPLQVGQSGENAYILYPWICGRDAAEILPLWEKPAQYACGRRAGEALRVIHALPGEPVERSWQERYNRKIDAKLRACRDCPVELPGRERYFACIQSSRSMLTGRPQAFQHGDYHIGNMLLDERGNLHIIDFNRLDTGDPWEEFDRITWCAAVSPAFASGRIDGYFDGKVPPEFFALMALYIAVNQVSTLPWAVSFGQEEIRVALRQAREVLNWYDDLRTCRPGWYTPL